MFQSVLSLVITILSTVFIFGLIIFIHELGHYCVARAFKIGIKEFSIGMGPRVKVWKGKYNDFALKAFPVGGSVSMVGETPGIDDEEPLGGNKSAFREKKVWQRICVLAAGPLMNLVLGFVLMFIIVASTTIPSTTIGKFEDNATSNKHGLQEKDKIIEINGDKIHVYNDMSFKIAFENKEPFDILVIRNNEKVLVEGVIFPVDTENTIAYGTIDFSIYRMDKSFGTIIYQGFFQSISMVEVSIKSWFYVMSGDFGWNAVSGPIGVGQELGNVIKESNSFYETIISLLSVAALLSFAVFIFNLLPIPVLDGGHILFCIIEKIRGKPVNPKVEQTLMAAFMLILFAFIGVIALKDIVNLF